MAQNANYFVVSDSRIELLRWSVKRSFVVFWRIKTKGVSKLHDGLSGRLFAICVCNP